MRNTFHTCLTRNLFICRMFISVSNLSCGNHYFISEKKKNDLKHVKKKNIYIHEKRKDNEKKKKYNMWKSRDRERLHIYIFRLQRRREKKKKRYTFFTVKEKTDDPFFFLDLGLMIQIGNCERDILIYPCLLFFCWIYPLFFYIIFSLLFSFEFCGGLCCKYRCLPIYVYTYIYTHSVCIYIEFISPGRRGAGLLSRTVHVKRV